MGTRFGTRKSSSRAHPADGRSEPTSAHLAETSTAGGRDAARRHDAQDLLRSSQTQLAKILDSANDPVISIDANQIVTLFNKGAARIFAYSPAEVIGRPWDLLIPQRFAAMDRQQIANFIESPKASRRIGRYGTVRGRRKDGREFPIEVSLLKLKVAGKVSVTAFLRDTTERRHLEHELERKNTALSTQQDTSLDAILLVDENAKIISYNRKFVEMWGIPEELIRSQQDDPVLHSVVGGIEHPDDFVARVKYLYEHKHENSREEIRTRTGRVIDRFTAPVISQSGEYYGRVWYFRDITESRRADASLRRANRALLVISAVNEALIRGESESALLDTVCRLLLDSGGYRMAWIGLLEHDPERSVRPVAQSGYEDGYLARAAISWADTKRGRGPTGTAARSGSVQVCRDIASDPRMVEWRADALQRGYASAVALPLIGDCGTFAVMSIYSTETDAFDDEEVALLQKLAANLAVGIVTQRSNLERDRAVARAERLANFDALTELPNRLQLITRLGEAIEKARARAEPLALMTISVDRFSEIQDGFGIAGADELTRKVAMRIATAAGGRNFMARIAGESFAIFIPQADTERVHETAIRIQLAMNDPFEYAGVPIDVQATNGVALFPDHGLDSDELIRRSDIAIRQARAAGMAYALYSGKSETESPQRLVLLAELRRTIKSDGLLLHFQPKIDLRSGTVSGVEALVRWPHPERGLVPPVQFVPLAEQTGLIKPITRWVVDAALLQMAGWQRLGKQIPVAVNVSPNNLRDPDFLEQLVALHTQGRARLDLLQVEVTETALMEDPEKAREVLARIRDLGMQIFIDDFGTGYSSLSYIATLPINGLKIDRSFVLDMMKQPRHRAVVSASISLAHTLGLKVVAEGIESVEQARALSELGCDEIQGYLYSKPLPAEDFLRWYAAFELQTPGSPPVLRRRQAGARRIPEEGRARRGEGLRG